MYHCKIDQLRKAGFPPNQSRRHASGESQTSLALAIVLLCYCGFPGRIGAQAELELMKPPAHPLCRNIIASSPLSWFAAKFACRTALSGVCCCRCCDSSHSCRHDQRSFPSPVGCLKARQQTCFCSFLRLSYATQDKLRFLLFSSFCSDACDGTRLAEAT